MWPFGNRRMYFDYASSTLPLKEAVSAMREAERLIGNPGAIHTEAVAAKEVLEKARERIARELACKSREIVFTSGLTEAINLAVLGYARKLHIKNKLSGTHWIVSSIEHSAVLESFVEIERLGGSVTHIDPDERGLFAAERVLYAVRPETVFISIGWANNETGVVQPIRDISRVVKEKYPNIIFHSDAGQAPLYLPPRVHTLGIDLMSFGSNKLYGPHGAGAIYRGGSVELAPIVLGGGQERGLRSGTENVALAAGFAEALCVVGRERDGEAGRLRKLRDQFARELVAHIPPIVINTPLKHSLPHMLNVSIPDIQSEYITLALDRKGIAISTKSACAEGGKKQSHVVAALGGPVWHAENTLRFSFGRDTRPYDVASVVQTLHDVLESAKT